MIRSAGREQSEIAVISCQDQGRSTARVLQKGWYQLAVASTYEVCGTVVGARDLKQQLVREWLVFEVYCKLPSFQNGFQFNCHFGLRLDFGLDTLHYPLQHRPRFWLGFFMGFHVRLQCTCVPATLVTSRAFKLFIRHLFSENIS